MVDDRPGLALARLAGPILFEHVAGTKASLAKGLSPMGPALSAFTDEAR